MDNPEKLATLGAQYCPVASEKNILQSMNFGQIILNVHIFHELAKLLNFPEKSGIFVQLIIIMYLHTV